MASTIVKSLFASIIASAIFVEAAVPLDKRALTITQNLPTGWTYKSCYTDVGRTINGASYIDNTKMTQEACVTYCDGKGYAYAGVEYSTECFCGNTLASGSAVAPAADCGNACSGDATEACGGGNRLTLFYNPNAKTPAGPSVNPGPPGWTSLGCYTEGNNGRTLTNGVQTTGGSAAMTIALCTAACKNGNYKYAGAEYSGECYCGNTISNGGAPTTTGCTMTCNGNQTEYCGGGGRLNVYQFGAGAGSSTTSPAASPTMTVVNPTPTGPAIVPYVGGYSFLGCYTEATGNRALSGQTTASNTMTLETCQAYCAAYTFFGVEYGQECYCGNTINDGSVMAPNQGDCNFICPGNAGEYCGAGNRLEMYKKGAPGSSSTTATGTTAGPTTTVTTTATSAATNLPDGWAYAGCYKEGTSGRALPYQQPDSQTNTNEKCIAACIAAGYSVAGMEYSTQCYCANALYNGAVATTNDQCSMNCPGNNAEKCGAGDRLSIFSKGDVKVYQPPAVQKTNLPGSWTYRGCVQDNVNDVRTFPWAMMFPGTNTASTCLNTCAGFGYMAAGLEYGSECYCGDIDGITAAGAQTLAESQCDVACAGNPSYLCGGGSKLSWYQWTGTPLYEWSYGSGISAGKYENYIGGVVIPLLTTTGVNGKITFVEKFGTGEPNSTGAYELDPSLKDDFAKAWRPMHVKTDVFCSASITLPDKAGRQLNIGGWSGDSTFGIRIYWPDGSPGVASKNDWQENVNEVKLQTGRWYPSAMVMTNGSVLVVGGEEGSNGAPVPSLELLPKSGGILTMDWLQRTDPFNLYPFLSILPTGGILVLYYNEARILDPVTFDTTKQLPNMPGAVNNPLGGRTYPLEGTSVLLPQHGPDWNDFGVLVCGGSTPGAGYALDNCVSTDPTAAAPKWQIERMPSTRVITCMTALPDGTYMILNGAHHGVAGFGLAVDPNLNAVLYDPRKDVNKRMTVMANTTVARLYHSEAILMQDGRVLVSGSDPQDGKNPEEYRVETFTPPYLLNGNPIPKLTSLSSKDMTYSQTITMTVQLTGITGITASMMGAESSTHGNSMGQRTLMPQVTCSSTTTCTFTTPKNNMAAPPGWYQVFVLENGTPSKSIWVRLGGDPGGIGNWPDSPSFTVPGV